MLGDPEFLMYIWQEMHVHPNTISFAVFAHLRMEMDERCPFFRTKLELGTLESNQQGDHHRVFILPRARRAGQTKRNAANDTAAPLAGHHKTIASVGGGRE